MSRRGLIVALLLTLLPLSRCQAAPSSTPAAGTGMTRVQYHDLSRKHCPDGGTVTVWSCEDQLRVEHGESVVVMRGKEAWVRAAGRTLHAATTDASFRALACGFHLPPGFEGLAPGGEVAWVEHNGGKKGGEMTRNGIRCDLWVVEKDDSRLLLFTRKDTELPYMLMLDGDQHACMALEYTDNARDLAPQPSQFEPLAGPFDERPEALTAQLMVWASPGSDGHTNFPVPFVYARWEDEVTTRYGRESLARYNESLYEDLPPFKDVKSGVPSNPEIEQTFTRDPALAATAISDALQTPLLPLWSLIARNGSDVIPMLRRIAATSSSSTDRAAAYQALESRHASIVDGLLDDASSVRLICMSLLGGEGDALALLPLQPQNPFQFFFVEKALARLIPAIKPADLYRMPLAARLERCPPAARQRLLTLARAAAQRPAAAIILYAMGSPAEGERAEKTFETLLLAQGGRPDIYHSADYWIRTDIIQVLGAVAQRAPLLGKRFKAALSPYSPQRDMLIIALAYALAGAPDPSAVDALASVRRLKTDNYDVYTAAALALTALHNREAWPSLLHLLSLRRHPFGDVAVQAMESLSGVETPQKPRDLGVLNNMGVPREALDLDAAYTFWKNWYEKNRAPRK